MNIHTILTHTDLRTLAEEAGAVFNRQGRSVCPLHPGADNPAAFHLYSGRDGCQRWHCFTRCPDGENGGDAISFYMRWRGVDFGTAIQDLADCAGLGSSLPPSIPPYGGEESTPVLPPRGGDRGGEREAAWQARAAAFLRYAQEQLWSPGGAAVQDYLRRERGLEEETLRAWGLGYNPRDVWQAARAWGLSGGRKLWCPRGVVLPAVRDGLIRGVKVRRPLPGDPLSAAIGPVKRLPQIKFAALRGGRATLYGVDRLVGRPVLLLAEGEFDALLAWQAAGDLCDVASLGGAGRRLAAREALPLLRTCVLLAAYDADAAGVQGSATLRALSGRVIVVRPPAHDLTVHWRAGGDLRAWIAAHVAQHLERLLSHFTAEIAERTENAEKIGKTIRALFEPDAWTARITWCRCIVAAPAALPLTTEPSSSTSLTSTEENAS